MKKWVISIAAVLAGLVVFLLSSGGAARTPELASDGVTMTRVAFGNGYQIYVHEATGVWYLFRLNDGGVTVMVGADGTPYTGE